MHRSVEMPTAMGPIDSSKRRGRRTASWVPPGHARHPGRPKRAGSAGQAEQPWTVDRLVSRNRPAIGRTCDRGVRGGGGSDDGSVACVDPPRIRVDRRFLDRLITRCPFDGALEDNAVARVVGVDADDSRRMIRSPCCFANPRNPGSEPLERSGEGYDFDFARRRAIPDPQAMTGHLSSVRGYLRAEGDSRRQERE